MIFNSLRFLQETTCFPILYYSANVHYYLQKIKKLGLVLLDKNVKKGTIQLEGKNYASKESSDKKDNSEKDHNQSDSKKDTKEEVRSYRSVFGNASADRVPVTSIFVV